ncbi:NKG2-A/NKG2-B type II integral membrane protein-like isoform X1 [Grammomys surdaster]|uniref:NKG2-A/NKG2-B type II integral membrane protein-like isoform X1 n=1 Tax=Grammomys surdaster TaxID=491861 RepID=UPI00109FA955|nr:NKG2-A/NKG2-B type II integral membrane protein-like isoform X1 [Grammomys surdaster]XP_028636842.1 NKG2-A/NKG2-B type II integral membrane protein-like isoform X1 [Grammomys surdaster]XP_028636845.1 NKG2-A/NKG2-B type II integral membrane protein-like isoform X1 [Grammomys surdaster]
MSHPLGTECASEPRKASKKTQSQLRFSNGARDQLLEFSFQRASQKHLKTSRHGYCKNVLSPPERLISGILGIIWFALLIALVISTRIVSPYTEQKKQMPPFQVRNQKDINHNLSSAQPCAHCPKEWISYSHNCYYISVEKKSWSDGLVSCVSKNCSLLYIDSEEEMDFLESLSLVSWARVCQKSRGQPWVQIKDSTFNSQISETSHDEHDCIICIMLLSGSGLIADNCTALHTYICKCKLTN